MNRVEKDIVVKNTLGLHARPAAMLVRLANTFDSDIFLRKDGEPVNCKSVLSLLMLSAGNGTVLRLSAEGGADAGKAIEAISELFDSKFNEEK